MNMLNLGNSKENVRSLIFVSSDLFNNPNCQPACQTVQDGDDAYEECRMIVGYNDLLHTIPKTGQIVRTQIGEYWDFTCKRKLTGEASGDGAVSSITDENEKKNQTLTTDFNMDIMCCDPEEDGCQQVSTFTMIRSN